MLARVLAATVAGGIVFFLLGFLIYGLFLEPMVMKPNMNPDAAKLMKDPPSWIPLVLANLVSAMLLAYIIERAGTRTFGGGLSVGAVVFFFIALSFQLMFAAFMNLMNGYVPAVADVIGSTVMGAIGGGVIGMVLGMMNKEPAVAT